MILRYSDPEKVDKEKCNKMIFLHAEMVKKYAKFANMEFSEGKKLL